MLVMVVLLGDIDRVRQQLIDFAHRVDIFEFRVDTMTVIDYDIITDLMQHSAKPVMLTHRSQEGWGTYCGDPPDQYQILRKLLALQPHYLDVEHRISRQHQQALIDHRGSTELVLSYHCRYYTPDILSVFESLYHPQISHYKLVTEANSVIDGLRMLVALQTLSQHHQISAHCVGEQQLFTRILSPVLGGVFQYAQPEQSVLELPLPTVSDLEAYHLRDLNTETQIYALLGHPTEKSLGHKLHNRYYQRHQLNAVYVKIDLAPHELQAAFSYFNLLPFAGFSVTMPLKKHMPDYSIKVSDAVAEVGCANTLKRYQKHHWAATNTDVLALQQIFSTCDQQQVLIIGNGGLAHALAYAARAAKKSLTFLCRDHIQCEKMAIQYQGRSLPADTQVSDHYDWVINATPITPEDDTWPFQFTQEAAATIDDVTYHIDDLTSFAMRLFINQAAYQILNWFSWSSHCHQHIVAELDQLMEGIQRDISSTL